MNPYRSMTRVEPQRKTWWDVEVEAACLEQARRIAAGSWERRLTAAIDRLIAQNEARLRDARRVYLEALCAS